MLKSLRPTSVSQVAAVFEKAEKPAVVWLHFQECTCCSESFLRASHPIVLDVLLDVLSLNYTETLQAPAPCHASRVTIHPRSPPTTSASKTCSTSFTCSTVAAR